MSKDINGWMINNWTLLTTTVRLKDIAGILIERGVISPAEWEELKEKNTGEVDRMEAFLLKLVRKAEDIRELFLLALSESPYAHVYQKLTSGINVVSSVDTMKTLQLQVATLIKHAYDEKLVKDKDILDLKSKVQELDKLNAKMPQLQADVNNLTIQLQQKREAIETLRKENAELKDENKELVNKVEILSQHYTSTSRMEQDSVSTCSQSTDREYEDERLSQQYCSTTLSEQGYVSTGSSSIGREDEEGEQSRMNYSRSKRSLCDLENEIYDLETKLEKKKKEVEVTKRKTENLENVKKNE